MHYLFLFIAALLRWLPHPFNVTPIGAIGLFAGAHCDRRVAWAMPLVPLAIGDLLIGGYHPLIMGVVYLAFVITTVIGRWLLATRRSVPRLAGAVGLNALVFYLLTNAPVWWVYDPHTLAGLVDCYVRGLPLLVSMLAGDAVFTTLLFGGHALVRRVVPRRPEVPAN